jgi:hypothetical protein
VLTKVRQTTETNHQQAKEKAQQRTIGILGSCPSTQLGQVYRHVVHGRWADWTVGHYRFFPILFQIGVLPRINLKEETLPTHELLKGICIGMPDAVTSPKLNKSSLATERLLEEDPFKEVAILTGLCSPFCGKATCADLVVDFLLLFSHCRIIGDIGGERREPAVVEGVQVDQNRYHACYHQDGGLGGGHGSK